MTQLTLQLEPNVGSKFSSLRECVASGIYQRGLVAVAGRIDRQPSHLSEALSGSERRKLSVDELEAYIKETGDITPIHYLVSRYLRDPEALKTEALASFVELSSRLTALAVQAGLVEGSPAKGRTQR